MQEQAATTPEPRTALRARSHLLDRPKLVLGIAAGLHVGLFLLLLGTQLLPHNRWYFPSDDQIRYYGFAKGLSENLLVPQSATIGYDLFVVPYATATDFVLQAIPFVAVTQLALGLGAAALVYRAGLRLLDRRAAVAAAALWLLLPLAGLLYRPTANGPTAIWLGFQIAVDYGAALLTAAVIVVAAGSLRDPSVGRGVVLGALGGLDVLVKPPDAIALASALVALLVWRRFAAAAAAAAVAAVVFVPQLAYNARLFGNATSFAYTPSVARRYLPQYPNLVGGTFSVGNLPRAYGRLVLHNYTGPIALLAVGAVLFLTWRRYPAARWLVVAQVVGFALFYGFYRYGIGDAVLRYLTPALPAIALAAGGALGSSAPVPEPVRPPRAAWVAALALGGSAALSAWIAVASPAPNLWTAGKTAAAVSGSRVTVSWRPPPAPAHLAYYLVRSREPSSRTTIHGFDWFPLPPGRRFGVRGTSYVDRPPAAGTWWYRPLIAPGPRDHGWPPGVPVGSLPPVRVVLP